MTIHEFRASVSDHSQPPVAAHLLSAMWWAAKGDWNRAHELAQDVASSDGAWVHAYLHRKEGDAGKAGYWYRQARKPHSNLPLEAEWEEIVTALLADPISH